jgi:F-type H+-transporting ATPase subunit a
MENTNHIFEHLIPQVTPTMLIPFIVSIKTFSSLIPPGTLSVRLTTNIIVGHLPLILLGNNGPSIRHTILTVLITAQILLLILEAEVAVYN